MLHKSPLDSERLVQRQSLVSRRVRPALDEHHDARAERHTSDAKRLRRMLCKGQNRWLKLEVRAVQLDPEFWVWLRYRNGDRLGRSTVGERVGKSARRDLGFNVWRHTEDGIVGTLLDAISSDRIVYAVEEIFRNLKAWVELAETSNPFVDRQIAVRRAERGQLCPASVTKPSTHALGSENRPSPL